MRAGDVTHHLVQQLQPVVDHLHVPGGLAQVRPEESDSALAGALVQQSEESHFGFLLTSRSQQLQVVRCGRVDDGGLLRHLIFNFQSLGNDVEVFCHLDVLKKMLNFTVKKSSEDPTNFCIMYPGKPV